jgi:hypothetical protein
MNLRELTSDLMLEKQIWARSGKKVVRKYRCAGGQRHGRIVSTPAQCFKPKNLKRRVTAKRTQARLGKRIARKAQRTKRHNAVSKRVRMMNKSRR